MLGPLRHRITLKPHIPVWNSDYGTWDDTWPESAWRDVWASVQPMSARERAMYNDIAPDVAVRVIVRHDASDPIGDNWIVEHDDTAFDVEEIRDPSERHEHVTLLLRRRD